MSKKMVTVVARAKAAPGMEDAVRRELLHMVEETRKEAGCINYDLHVAADRPDHFLFYENWEEPSALERHAQAPHVLAFRARAHELLAEPTEILLYEMISEPAK